MPLMLDNPLGGAAMAVDLDDVDDLFGDSVPLALSGRPPSKRLQMRLDELRSRGCCQTLAWSKAGTIASISPDGLSLEFQYIRANPKDASWYLSEPRRWSPPDGLLGGPMVHLAWAPTNLLPPELAVVDAVGRVSILSFLANVNSPSISRKWDSDQVDDLHAVVGSFWLNTTPLVKGMYQPLHSAAVKSGLSYTYENTSTMGNPPYHPNPNRSAFLCVTTNGVLRMFWNQNNSNRFEETTLEIESITSSDDAVTHAAICSDGRVKCLLVVLATASKQLQVLQVALNWGFTQENSGKNIPPAAQPLSPVFKERHIAISTWLPGGDNESSLDTSMTELSLLELIPPAVDGAIKSWVPAIIVAARTFVPTPDSPYQEVQSIIDRWEVPYEQPQTLHPAFEQLGSKRNSTAAQPTAVPRLKRLEPIVVNKIIVGISVMRLGTVLCFTYSDGSIEYRDRITMNEMWNTVNLDRISSVLEAGFTQSTEASCLQTIVSPTFCSLIQMCEDGKVKWHGVKYTLAEPDAQTDGHLSAVLSAMTVTAAQAALSAINIDDILAVARQFLNHRDFASRWVTEMVKMLKIAVDYTEELPHDSLVRNSSLQMCLSTLNHLGWNGEYQPRGFRGKLAMLALNLRNIVIVMTIASNGPQGVMKDKSPLDEPEVVNVVAGCCKWSMDLLCWLSDSLFCLLDDRQFMERLTSNFSIGPYLLSKNDVSLHMVLSSVTRGLLSAVCRRLSHLHSISQRAVAHYEQKASNPASEGNGAAGIRNGPEPLQEAYQKILRYTSTSMIKVQDFEKLLVNLSGDVRKQYAATFASLATSTDANAAQHLQNPSQNPNAPKPITGEEAVKRAKAECELQLLLASGGPPAQTFQKLVLKFFTTDLTEFREHTDPAELYYGNYEILEIDDNARALLLRRQKLLRVDLFKRVEIPPVLQQPSNGGGADQNGNGAHYHAGPSWRRCARCASVMEDMPLVASRPGLNFVLSQQKNCCCSGRLALVASGEAAMKPAG